MTSRERSGSSAIRDFLTREIALGSFPGAAWAVGNAAGIVEEGAAGHAVSVPLRIEATVETIYDCASLTKPLVTAQLVLQAVGEGRISLDDSFHGYTYRELLTHTSGLRAWLPLYALSSRASSEGPGWAGFYPQQRGNPAHPGPSLDARDDNAYLEVLLQHGAEIARGSDVIYSDLNFVLLWYALRELYGDYASAARERVFQPLGLRDACFHPPASLKPRIAATEFGQRWEARMCAERKIACERKREGLIWGETHDGNSHYAGGTAGNAGLFATARDVFHLAQSWASLLPPTLAADAIRNHTGGKSDARGLGWQKPTGSEATKMLSPDAYGHTGFTGTSVWVDGEWIYVLLTNRVHPCAAPVAMQRIRGEFHRIAIDTVGS